MTANTRRRTHTCCGSPIAQTMELREYLHIVRRRWWLPLLLTLLVAFLSAVQLQPWRTPPPTYTASLRLLLGVLPLAEADITQYDPRYYAWLTSEYLVDDFTEVVGSALFAQNTSARLAEQGITIPAGLIGGSAITSQQHRIITLQFGWPNHDEATLIAQAAAAELTENAALYFAQLGTPEVVSTLLDGPTVVAVGPDLRSRIELPLRILLGFVAGIVLVFLLDYLDTSLRRPQELEDLGLPVLGAIPRQ